VSITQFVEHGHSLLEVGLGEVSVTHGHLEIGVPQEFLHRLQAYPVHHQLRGKGMAQIMKPEAIYFRFPAGGGERPSHVIKPFAIRPAKDEGGFQVVLLAQPLEHPGHLVIDRDLPGPPAFGLRQVNQPVVDLLPF